MIALNYINMCYEGFSDYAHNTSYFEEKVHCHDRPFYEFSYEEAKKELHERLKDYDVTSENFWQTDEEYQEEIIDEILKDFDSDTGVGSKGYAILSEIDRDCWEYIDNIGKVKTGILELYMLAFELAQEQLNSKKEGAGENDRTRKDVN